MKTPVMTTLLLALALPVQAQTAAPAVAPATDALRSEYAAAIRDRIVQHWVIGETVSPGQRCRVGIVQLPGGMVAGVKADATCAFDAAGRAALEAAVLRAQPLPYKGFEAVFARSLNITFVAEG
ncbi:hypothetical protein D3C87_304740 [compost metagenome]